MKPTQGIRMSNIVLSSHAHHSQPLLQLQQPWNSFVKLVFPMQFPAFSESRNLLELLLSQVILARLVLLTLLRVTQTLASSPTQTLTSSPTFSMVLTPLLICHH